MKVAALRKPLKKLKDEAEIRIDNDEEGFYTLDAVEVITEDDEQIVNLISSNEA